MFLRGVRLFINKLIVAYQLNQFSTCNVKRKVNWFDQSITTLNPALESMNLLLDVSGSHTTTQSYTLLLDCSFLSAVFFFSFICSWVSQMPYSLSLFCLVFCAFLFPLFCIVVLASLILCVLITQIILCECTNCDTPLDVITCVFVLPCPLQVQMGRLSTACCRKPATRLSFNYRTIAYRALPDPMTKSDGLM